MSAPQRPGQQPPWSDHRNRSGETDVIPRVQDQPFQFTDERPPPTGNPALTWALRIAGLVAIAVISGLVWGFVTDKPAPPAAEDNQPTEQKSKGRYDFVAHEKLPQPKVDTDCAKNSYGKVKDQFFPSTPCTRLTRALYTVEVDGRLVYTSVSVVQMPTEEAAAALNTLTEQDGTGNVSDSIKAKLVQVDGLANGLGGGGYESNQRGKIITIVESDYAPAAKRTKAEDGFLTAISADAIRLGEEIAPDAS
ncbi:MAG: hypothetical protein M3548_17715 [Actinomycetota bacterium]|nr:hypothetical protein [Actinomycetota bacterium]